MNLASTMSGVWAVDEASIQFLQNWHPEVKGVDSPMVAEAQSSRRQGIATIGLYGFMEYRQSLLGYLMGGTSTKQVGEAFDRAMEDQSVKGILLDVDSPGGSVFGVQELATKIREARGTKPIVAVANATAASGAYWVASAADRVYVTPSGAVGSVGVYIMHTDESKALESEGVKIEVIKSSGSPYKAEMSGVEPLSDAGRGAAQSMVDTTYENFVSDISKGRGVSKDDVRKNYGKGRIVLAGDALSAGMVDRIGTSEDVLGRMLDGRIRISRGKVYDDDGGIRVDSARARIAIERNRAY